ncbi:unnamed protein product [Callosobruchus maculatus]|uniref:Adenylate kinase 8 n=1 Tax=Callosobruchus maculatus TaxID=64391 RepID=A0A653C5K5_CALMS|nr:unnamed protein product [Callosobruchus maculatus]
MSDPTKRPLKFPPQHIPYLQKHRILELFHEIARELVIQKPEDHVLFTKQILHNAARSRDVPRVILIPSYKVNALDIAKCMSNVTKQVVISRINLESCLGTEIAGVPSEVIAKCLAYLVRKENCYNLGWIMVDCIRNEQDAKELLQLGIIPTHTIHLISPFQPNLDELLYCNVRPSWPEYRRNIVGMRNAFKASLREIHLGDQMFPKIVQDCLELCKVRKAVKPIQPRVLIIGPRGSGRKTQAKLLAEKLGLICIDFEYLICQVWISATELGTKLRECKNKVCFHSELLSEVVNRRILEEDALRKGWVLVSFPYTDLDFRYLDSLDTPPNRVIFLECDLTVCKERLRHRRVNVYSGSVTNIEEHPKAVEEKTLKTHPKDDESVIDAELKYYCEQYGNLRKYCGPTASFVNGDQNERWVHECILGIILRAPIAAPPRKGLADLANSSSSSSACSCVSVPTTVLDAFVRKV